jgi:hypothetical protein
MSTIISPWQLYTLELLLTDSSGNGATGLIIPYNIKKSETEELIEESVMEDIGLGVYKKNIVISNIGQYRVYYSTPVNYDNAIETLLVRNCVDSTVVSEILVNTISIINGLTISPNNPNTYFEDYSYNLHFDNEFTLLKENDILYGNPVLTIHYTQVCLQCILLEINTEVGIEVSNDGSNWISLYTFNNNGIKILTCFKYIRAKLISGKAIISCVGHRSNTLE